MKRDSVRRYARQIILPEVGVDGQQRLMAARVLIVGLGGLGSPIAQYLAAAGVGTLGLSEFDVLELHNLQRQTLYGTSGVGAAKLTLALERLREVNPELIYVPHDRLEPSNAAATLERYDLVIDATDNFAARYLIADTCAMLGKTCVWGAAVGWEGMASVFDAQMTLRDLFPEPPSEQEDCDTLGVHGPLLGVIGSVMASQAIKHLLGLPTLRGKLWLFDALNGTVRCPAISRA